MIITDYDNDVNHNDNVLMWLSKQKRNKLKFIQLNTRTKTN